MNIKKNMREILKNSKTLLLLVVVFSLILFTGFIGINYLENNNKTKINVKNHSMKKIVYNNSNLSEENTVSGYDRILYNLKYTLTTSNPEEKIKKDITILVNLTEDEVNYASFEELNENNITSEIINEGRTLKLSLKDIITNEEQSLKIGIKLNGAPNDFEISPTVTIKANTGEESFDAETTIIKTTSLTGTIKNVTDNSLVKKLQVILCKLDSSNICISEKVTYTDDNGKYSFSEIEEGNYKINVLGNYNITNNNFSISNGTNVVNLEVAEKENDLEITKFLKEATVIVDNEEKKYTFDKTQKVKIPVDLNKVSQIKALYEFEIVNNGTENGYINVIKENIPDGMELDPDYEENKNWENSNSMLINKTLENELLKPGDTKTITIKLKTNKKVEAKSYLNKVSISEEEYHNVKYVVNGEVVRSLSVQDFDKVESFEYENGNYKVEKWYEDISLEKEFDFSKTIEKDTLIYGKIASSENENEENEPGMIITPGDQVSGTEALVKIMNENEEFDRQKVKIGSKAQRPASNPIKKGYNFVGWYEINLDGTFKEKEFDFNNLITKNTVLYAKYKINTYDIIFMDGDTELTDYRQKIDFDKHVMEPENNPTKKDYNFVGWYEKKSDDTFNDTAFDFNNMIVEKNIVLYAKFDKKQYRVQFYDKDLNNPINKKTLYDIGSEIEVPTPEPRENLVFDGWYEKKLSGDYKNSPYEFKNNIVSKSVKLYAKFSKKKYTVTFIVNSTSYVEKQIEEDETIPVPTNPKLDYYSFEHWSLEENGEAFDFSTNVRENITLYAVFTRSEYLVTFHNGGINKVKRVNAGTIINTPKVSLTGHTFKYWSLSENGEEYDILLNPVTEDIDLYAVYEKNEYTVKFYNGEEKIGEKKFKFADKIDFDGIEPPEKEGKRFVYWETKTNDGEIKEFLETNLVTSNINLYAHYVNFDCGIIFINKFAEENVIAEVEHNGHGTPLDVEAPEGYTFKYWSLSENGEAFDFENTIINEIITLHAVYDAEQVNIKFMNQISDSQYEAIDDYETNVDYNTNVTTPNDPEREGYVFLHWSTEKNGEAFDFATKLKENITLYAVYEKIKYNLTINLSQGEYDGVTGQVNYKLSSDDTMELKIPSNKYYNFEGWEIEGNATIDDNNILTMGKGDSTLTAKWTPKTFTVTFINDDEVYKVEEVEYNNTASLITIPNKENSTFEGWSLTPNDSNNLFDFSTRISSNINLYSIYSIKTFRVRYMAQPKLNSSYEQVPVYKTDTVKYGNLAKEYNVRDLGAYDFWTSDETPATNYKKYDFKTPVTSDLVLFPISIGTLHKVQYKTLNNNNKYVINNSLTEYTDDSGNVKLPAVQAPSGLVFSYWSLLDPETTPKEELTKYESGTGITTNIVLYAVYSKAQNTVNFISGDNLYSSVDVSYDEQISEEQIPSDPTSVNGVFEGWYLNEELFDFSTKIVDDITLQAKFREVKKPVINLSTKEWVSHEGLTVSISGDDVEYKIDDGEYNTYTNELKITENCIITARNKEKDLYSEEVIEEIKNIDINKPEISSVRIENITNNSFEISLKAIDNESKIKKLNIYLDDNTVPIYTMDYTNQKEISELILASSLTNSTSYSVKIEIIDNANNESIQTEEVSTLATAPKAVNIISIDDTILDTPLSYDKLSTAILYCEENNKKCTIQLQKDLNDSVEILDGADITLDLNGKTLNSTRDYTLSNNGTLNIINSSDSTGTIFSDNVAIKNNSTGTLTIGSNDGTIDNKIMVNGSTSGIINNGVLNYYDGTIKGTVSLKTSGIINTPESYNIINNTEDNLQVSNLGNETLDYEARINNTYYTKLKNAMTSAVSNQTVTVLKNVVLSDQVNITDDQKFTLDLNSFEVTTSDSEEVKIINNGELKITDLTDDRNNPEIDSNVYPVDLSKISNTYKNPREGYSFDYVDGKLISNNKGTERVWTDNDVGFGNDSIGNVKVDLTKKQGRQKIIVNAEFSSGDQGFIKLSKYSLPHYLAGYLSSHESDKVLASFSSNSQPAADYSVEVDGGEVYYLHFIYARPTGPDNSFYEPGGIWEDRDDTLTINSAKTINLVTNEESEIDLSKINTDYTSKYSFEYENGKLISGIENASPSGTIEVEAGGQRTESALGYLEIDLSEKTGTYDINIDIYYHIYAPIYMYITDKTYKVEKNYYPYSKENTTDNYFNQILERMPDGSSHNESIKISLEGGRKYYLHLEKFAIRKGQYNVHDFIINRVTYQKQVSTSTSNIGNSSSSYEQIVNNNKLELEFSTTKGLISNNGDIVSRLSTIEKLTNESDSSFESRNSTINELNNKDKAQIELNNSNVTTLTANVSNENDNSLNSNIEINNSEISSITGISNLTLNSSNISNISGSMNINSTNSIIQTADLGNGTNIAEVDFSSTTITNLSVNSNINLSANSSNIKNISEYNATNITNTFKNMNLPVPLSLQGDTYLTNIGTFYEYSASPLNISNANKIQIKGLNTDSPVKITNTKDLIIINSDIIPSIASADGALYLSTENAYIDNTYINTIKNSQYGTIKLYENINFTMKNSLVKSYYDTFDVTSYDTNTINIDSTDISTNNSLFGSTNLKYSNLKLTNSNIRTSNGKKIFYGIDSSIISINNCNFSGFSALTNYVQDNYSSHDKKIILKNSLFKGDNSANSIFVGGYLSSYDSIIENTDIIGYANVWQDSGSYDSTGNSKVKNKVDIVGSDIIGIGTGTGIQSYIDVNLENSKITNFTTALKNNDSGSGKYTVSLNVNKSTIDSQTAVNIPNGTLNIGINDGEIENDTNISGLIEKGSNAFINFYDGIVTTDSSFTWNNIADKSELKADGNKYYLISSVRNKYKVNEKGFYDFDSAKEELKRQNGMTESKIDLNDFNNYSSNDYGFELKENKLYNIVNENIEGESNAYIPIDLTNKTGEYKIKININQKEDSNSDGESYAYISENNNLNINTDFIQNNPDDENIIFNNTLFGQFEYEKMLSGGKIYYIYLGYKISASENELFIIENISYKNEVAASGKIELIETPREISTLNVYENDNITLDLKGNNLELTNYPISNMGNLVITNTGENSSTIASVSKNSIDNSGNLTLENITIDGISSNGEANINNSSITYKMNVKGGNLYYKNSIFSTSDGNIKISAGANLYIISGSLTTTSMYGFEFIENNGVLQIGENDETVKDVPTIVSPKTTIESSDNAKIYYYDGEIKGAKDSAVKSPIHEIPSGYAVSKNQSDDMETITLKKSGKVKNIISNKEYDDLQTAISSAANNDVLEINSDIILNNSSLSVDKKVTIDLNGNFIVCNNQDYLINNTGNLKITNSKETGEIKVNNYFVNNSGTLILENIIVQISTPDPLSINNDGTIEINNSKINSSNTSLGILNNGTINASDLNTNLNFVNNSIIQFTNSKINDLESNNGEVSVTNSTIQSLILNDGTISLDGANIKTFTNNCDNLEISGLNSSIKTLNNELSKSLTISNITLTDFNNFGTVQMSNLSLSTMTNSGIVEAENMENLFKDLSNTGTINASNITGLISPENSGEITIKQSNLSTGTIINSGTVTLEQVTNSGTLYFENESAEAVININNSTLITGDITNNGTINNHDSNYSFESYYDEIENRGTINNYNTNYLVNSSGLNIENSGDFLFENSDLKGVNFLNNGNASISSNELINIQQITNNGTLTLSGKIKIYNGLVSTSNITLNEGTYTGNLELSGSVTLNNPSFAGDLIYKAADDLILDSVEGINNLTVNTNANISLTNLTLNKLDYEVNTELEFGSLTLTDCNISSINNINGIVLINNGTYSKINNGSNATITLGNNEDVYNENQIIINNGISNTGTLNYYDGTIRSSDPISYSIITNTATGYGAEVSQGEDSVYVMVLKPLEELGAVSINDKKFQTLTLALESVKDETNLVNINLNSMINQEESIEILSTQNINLNLNGNTLTLSNITNNGTLTINGSEEEKIDINVGIVNNGTLTFNKIYKEYQSNKNITNNGSLIINDSSVEEISSDSQGNNNITINASDVSRIYNINNLTINSGTVYNVHLDGSKHLEINGGKTAWVYGETENFTITNGEIDDIIIKKNWNITGGKITTLTFDLEDNSVPIDLVNLNNVNRLEFAKESTVTINDSIIENVHFNGGTLKLNNSSLNNLLIFTAKEEETADDIINTKVNSNIILDSSNISNNVFDNNDLNTYGDVYIKMLNNSSVSSFDYLNLILVLGEDDGVIGDYPKVNNNVNCKELYYYDGVISGNPNSSIKASKIVIPENTQYNKYYYFEGNNLKERVALSKIDETKLAFTMNGTEYNDLQSAIDGCETGNTCNITMNSNTTLNSDITIPSDKTVIIDYNNYELNTNGHTLTGNITENNGNYLTSSSSDLGATIKNLLNIKDQGDVSKNVVITNYDDGTSLDISSNYKLYEMKDEKYKKIKKLSLNNKVITINKLSSGKYKVVDDNNNIISFTITKDGKVLGNAKEIKKLTNELSSSVSNISFNENNLSSIYILLGLFIIIIGLVIVIKKNRKILKITE